MKNLYNIFLQLLYILQTPLMWLFLALIKIYQYAISPYLSASCRYTPTCSVYCYLSIKKFGIIKGGYYSLIRLLKCNPWGGVGIDAVKDK